MDIARWSSHGGHRTVDIVHWRLYDGHRTVDIARCTSHVGHRTVYIVWCTLKYGGHCMLDVSEPTLYCDQGRAGPCAEPTSPHPPFLCLGYAMSSWFGYSQSHSQLGSSPPWVHTGAPYPSPHTSQKSAAVAASIIC